MSLLRAAQRILLSSLVVLALSQAAPVGNYTHPYHCNGNPDEHILQSCCEPFSNDTSDLSGFNSTIYSIKTGDFSSSLAWCDMTTDGGGWMVVARRSSGKVTFDRLYEDYEHGFGNLRKDFWLGLRSLQGITNTNERSYEMRLDMYKQVNDTTTSAYAYYSSFKISSPDYMLQLGNFSGSDKNLMDNMMQFNGQPFSAKKTKLGTSSECSNTLMAGWWFSDPLDGCVARNGQTPGTVLTRKYAELSWYDKSLTDPNKNERLFGKYELKIRPTDCPRARKSST